MTNVHCLRNLIYRSLLLVRICTKTKISYTSYIYTCIYTHVNTAQMKKNKRAENHADTKLNTQGLMDIKQHK